MRRKTRIALIAAALIVVLTIVCTAVFAGTHRITVVSGERFLDSCPKRAKAGQEVTVYTVVVSDGELYVNGVDGRFVRPGEFVFTMPDRDVELKLTVIAFPDGA